MELQRVDPASVAQRPPTALGLERSSDVRAEGAPSAAGVRGTDVSAPAGSDASRRLRAQLAAIDDLQTAAQSNLTTVNRAGRSLDQLEHILAELDSIMRSPDGSAGAVASFDLARLRSAAQRMLQQLRFAPPPAPAGESPPGRLLEELEGALHARASVLGASEVSLRGAQGLVAAVASSLTSAGPSARSVRLDVSPREVAALVAD